MPEIEHDDSAAVHDPLHEHSPAPPASYADQQLQAERTETARRASQNQANEISKEARDFMESSTASAAKLAGNNNNRSETKKDFEQTANQAEKDVKQTADKVGKEAKQTADKAEKETKQAADKAEKNVKQAADKAGKKYEEIKDKAVDEYQELKGKAVDQYENNVKPNVEKGVEKGKKEGKKAEQWAEKNKDNPVVVGNAVVLAVLGGALSIGAYRMHSQNRLTWNVIGAVAGGLSAFAIGDYYVSQFFFKKYPPTN